MRRPLAWAAVATANLSAMTLFLWSQTAFLIVTMAGLAVGRLPGLHTAPTTPVWIAERIAWLPAFAVALAVLWMIFRRVEQAPPPRQHGRAVPATAEPGITHDLAAPALPTAAGPQAAPGPSEGRADAPSRPDQAGVLAGWPRPAATEEDG
jgi:hypothetical protein